MEGLFRALLDPKGDPGLRRLGLRLYALGLLAFHGVALAVLSFLLPQASHPALWTLAFLGAGWLYLQAQGSLRAGKGPLAPLLAVGLGASAFFFLGVMGLLLRPLGLLLLPLGLGVFLILLWQGEGRLLRRPGGGP
ncbi:hypothetical protein BVI061214_01603 [Thermus aquaticus]|uniref:Uncharacterized protein n=1 Tax=Thermus aquaticus TaxID=271 RepID=A0A0M9AEP8_THEAQ|nr:hypothetical protein [Thermus aquaticus]KOX90412.1 hypothetical protein BVI061214_01603 [Thermus aquaticus]